MWSACCTSVTWNLPTPTSFKHVSDTAVQIENLSKRYRIGSKQEIRDTLAGSVADILTVPFRNWRRLRRLSNFNDTGSDPDNIIWALNDVSIDVKRGERVGFIGKNGAGKSTLLKIISRITQPTSGRIVTRGRVAALLEVGTGFHPELTGRENIYLNGVVLGMRRNEISRRFDEIVDFSGVEKFLDTPVKRYSSGMRVRLAFSVAAHLEPEILIVDEVLAVGDAEFQAKCLGKMETIAGEGRTILFVSHNMGAMLRLVDRCVLLNEGQMVQNGRPKTVVDYYLKSNISPQDGEMFFTEDHSKAAQVLRVAIRDNQGCKTSVLDPTDDIRVDLDFVVHDDKRGKIDVLALLASSDGTPICSFNTRESPDGAGPWSVGRYRLEVVFPGDTLNCGDFAVKAVVNLDEKAHDNHPLHGTGLRLELAEASEVGSSGYRMRPKETLLAVSAKHSLSRIGTNPVG